MVICRKIFILAILFFAFLSVKSYSEVVNKVDVQGNERISLETIIIFGDITIGKNYERSDISLLIKKLYETSFFSNISVELKNNKLNSTMGSLGNQVNIPPLPSLIVSKLQKGCITLIDIF